MAVFVSDAPKNDFFIKNHKIINKPIIDTNFTADTLSDPVILNIFEPENMAVFILNKTDRAIASPGNKFFFHISHCFAPIYHE